MTCCLIPKIVTDCNVDFEEETCRRPVFGTHLDGVIFRIGESSKNNHSNACQIHV